MRPLVLDRLRGSLTQLAFVSLAPTARALENRCFTTPHGLMLRRPTKDQARYRLVSGRLVGESREDGGSANAAGLMTVLVPKKTGGSSRYEWASVGCKARFLKIPWFLLLRRQWELFNFNFVDFLCSSR